MGTADMSNEEVGAYIRLLCYQWCKGSIPDNDEMLRRLTMNAPDEVLLIVRRKFTADKALGYPRLLNQRLERERDKQEIFRQSRVANGKRGGRPRQNVETSNTYENLEVAGRLSKTEPRKSSSTSTSTSTYKGEVHKDARIILYLLKEHSRKHFVESADCLDPISKRLYEQDVTTEGVKQMIARQCEKWRDTQFADGLNPKTLFGEKFHTFYGNRDSRIISEDPRKPVAQNSGRNIGTFNENSAAAYKGRVCRPATKVSDNGRPDSGNDAPPNC